MMKLSFEILRAGALLTLCSPVWAGEAETVPAVLRLHYSMDEGRGIVTEEEIQDKDLSVGSDMGWGLRGVGGAGSCLGRVGQSEVFARNIDLKGEVGDYAAYTVVLWYQMNQVDATAGTLIDLVAEQREASGFQVHFCSRPGKLNGEREQSLALVVGPAGSHPHSGPGVKYAGWNNHFGALREWLFLAIVVDTRASRNQIRFYEGSEKRPARLISMATYDPQALPSEDYFRLGALSEVWLAQNGSDMRQRPIVLGTYVDDVRLYGSTADSSGALSLKQVEAVRREAIGFVDGH